MRVEFILCKLPALQRTQLWRELRMLVNNNSIHNTLTYSGTVLIIIVQMQNK